MSDVQNAAGGGCYSATLLLSPSNDNFRLEKHGLTPWLLRSMGELLCVFACYAPDKMSAVDLKSASALAFDVANRLDRMAGGANV